MATPELVSPLRHNSSVLDNANSFEDKEAYLRNAHRKRTSRVFWISRRSQRGDWLCPVLFQFFDLDWQAWVIRMLLIFRNMRQILIYASQLEDLYVKSEHRNKGIGKALFKELAIIAQEKVTALIPLFDHPN